MKQEDLYLFVLYTQVMGKEEDSQIFNFDYSFVPSSHSHMYTKFIKICGLLYRKLKAALDPGMAAVRGE